jgi:hypothetical protein
MQSSQLNTPLREESKRNSGNVNGLALSIIMIGRPKDFNMLIIGYESQKCLKNFMPYRRQHAKSLH